MALFRQLYEKVIHWANHRHAPYYLASVSFVESSVFPIPPDIMLIPMILSRPLKAWEYAAITTLASVMGALLGYSIGYFAFETIGIPLLQVLNCQEGYLKVTRWFTQYGFYALFLAGFTPIPFKLFTIGAGVTQMAIFPFIVGSFLGRSLRFFLVAGVVRFLGKKVEPLILRYIEYAGWLILGLLVMGIFIYYCY